MEESKKYSDFTSNAEIELDGSLRIVTGSDALANSLRMWISSFRGEILRNPTKGGYVIQWLMKPMSEETRVRIAEAIEEGLFEDFDPKITLQKLTVTPNYENKYWEIELRGYAPLLKESFSLATKLRRLST